MLTNITLFSNSSPGGWGLNILKDNGDSIMLEELPEELRAPFNELLLFCLRHKTPAERAAANLLDQVNPTLNDDERMALFELYPEWNSLETYHEGEIVRHDGALFRLTKEDIEKPKRASGGSGRARSAAVPLAATEKKSPLQNPAAWARLGPEPEEIVWTQPGQFDDGYNEGDRVRMPDGRLLVSKINGNKYAPELMPEVWEAI